MSLRKTIQFARRRALERSLARRVADRALALHRSVLGVLPDRVERPLPRALRDLVPAARVHRDRGRGLLRPDALLPAAEEGPAAAAARPQPGVPVRRRRGALAAGSRHREPVGRLPDVRLGGARLQPARPRLLGARGPALRPAPGQASLRPGRRRRRGLDGDRPLLGAGAGARPGRPGPPAADRARRARGLPGRRPRDQRPLRGRLGGQPRGARLPPRASGARGSGSCCGTATSCCWPRSSSS